MAIAEPVWLAFIVAMLLMLRPGGAGACCGGGNNRGEAEVAPRKAAVDDRPGHHH